MFSLNDPGWGRSGGSGGSGGSDDQRPPQQQRPPEGPPDLDELWRDFNRKLNNMFGRGGGGSVLPPRGGGSSMRPSGRGAGAGVGLVLGILLLLWLGSGFYIVQEGQVAAVMRFGEYKSLTDRPGFKWRLPYPIEHHETVDVQRLRQIEVGYRNNVKNKVPREALILTGDMAIVDLQFAVQYRVNDPTAWLFNNHPGPNPEEIVRQAAETAMRETVGRSVIDRVLYEERETVAREARALMQNVLDRYRAGIGIVDVTVQQVQPPEQVQAAFEDANRAAQDRERLINEGVAYANDVIPRARGTASRLEQEAVGYRQRVIATAEGDASRFTQVLTEYAKAPQVTRERMYLDTMQQIFANTSKVFIDSRGSGNLLYLPLDRILQQAGQAEPAARPGPPGPPERLETSIDAQTAARQGLRSREREVSR
ncbi:MAG TPA: FtsH protease activity modulator HflK [Burkholderiaceae bacterium]|nr:FtsH protease activity modulator HflK [Burkholderiaceae bacterium]